MASTSSTSGWRSAPSHSTSGTGSTRDQGLTDLRAAPIPEELKAARRWIVWRTHPVRGKVPVAPRTLHAADVRDASLCVSFEEAVEVCEREPTLAGVGVMFIEGEGFVGIDLDDCLDESGVLSSEAQAIVHAMATYTEISPSGRGVKMFGRGVRPEGAKNRSNQTKGMSRIEIYDSARFFTLTGRHLAGTPTSVSDVQRPLNDLCARLWPRPQSVADSRSTRRRTLMDDEVLERARRAENGSKFAALYDDGDTSAYGGDESAADAALLAMLAFWCDRDEAQMERAFSNSALGQREKWRERLDYRERSIRFALDHCDTTHADGERRRSAAATQRADVPQIVLGTDEHRVADEVVATLGQDPDLFIRGGHLVRVYRADDGAARIEPLPAAALREIVTERVELIKRSPDGDEKGAHPPTWLINAILARREFPGVRPLEGVADAPALRKDGTVVWAGGYDVATRLWVTPTGEPVVDIAGPTHADALAAVTEIYDLLQDFAFEHPEHQSAALAALLTLVGRAAFQGCAPLFLFDANVRAAGKTLLARVIARIATGREMPTSSYPGSAEELRKRITAAAIAGERLIALDNLPERLGDASLDRALTSERWCDRALGTNDLVDLPLRAVWFATGNNTQLRADTGRRVIHVRLDVLHERPEERVAFAYPNVIEHVTEHRGRLIRAAVTILAAYLRAGSPEVKTMPMGGFEGWVKLVPAAIVWLGLPDPVTTRKGLVEAADNVAEGLAMLLSAIERFDPSSEGIVLADVHPCLWGGTEPLNEVERELRAAFEEVAGRGGRAPTVRQIAAALKHLRRRVIGGRCIDIQAESGSRRGSRWHVVRIDPAKA